MESPVLYYAQKSWTETISSCLFMSYRLIKSTYKGRMKIVPSRFLSCPGSNELLFRLNSRLKGRSCMQVFQRYV